MADTTGTPEPAFMGTIGNTVGESTPWWPPAVKAREGAPNVVVVLFDCCGDDARDCITWKPIQS